MKLFKSKKAVALLATLVVAVAASIGAYAYFTSTGTGSGTATVGSATNWVIGQDGYSAAFTPQITTVSRRQGTQPSAGHGQEQWSANQQLNTIRPRVEAPRSTLAAAAAAPNPCTAADYLCPRPQGGLWRRTVCRLSRR